MFIPYVWLLCLISFFIQEAVAQGGHGAVVAFDLHEVIVHRSYRDTVHALVPLILKSLRVFLPQIWRPSFWGHVYFLIRNSNERAVGEQLYDYIVKHYPQFSDAHDDFFDVCNAYEPDARMISYIQELRERGYPIVLASNIGERCYELFCEKNSIFKSLFDKECITRKDDGYITKPSPLFFSKVINACNELHVKSTDSVIFIDDKKRNVDTAVRCGLSAFRFKTFDQFKQDLENILQQRQLVV